MKTFVLLCLLLFVALPACSPAVQKATQKAVFATTVQAGVSLVKDKFPDTEIVLKFDSLTRTFKGVGKLSKLEIVMLSNESLLLRRQIDWLKTIEIITSKGFAEIDKGYLVIRAGKYRSPRDSLSSIER